jgi:hypothetical protein
MFRKGTSKPTPRRAPSQDDDYVHYGVAQVSGKLVVQRIGDPCVDEDYDAVGDKFQAVMDSENCEYRNLFRMYPSGLVHPIVEIKPQENDSNDPRFVAYQAAQQEAQALVEAAFDQEFPEIGTKAQKFISEIVNLILSSFDGPADVPADFNDKTWLLEILQQSERELLAKGSATPQMGWEMAPGKVFVISRALPDKEDGKYRYARAISEIAQMVNARAIIHVGETWRLDVKTGKRNGKEGLSIMRILPDASVASGASATFVRGDDGQPQITEPASLDNPLGLHVQNLFPAWKIAGTVASQAPVAAVN